ncbi:MAG TPA: pentapeptide repeat-containing protein [Actinomycetes bacterium]
MTGGPAGFTALEVDGDYDGLELRGLDLSGQRGSQARFLDCEMHDCRLDDVQLRRARIGDTVLTDLRSVSLDVADSAWRDCVVRGSRIGAFVAPGATMTRLHVVGGKIDFVNLRGAHLVDVTFEGCRLGDVDCSRADLTRVAFPGCQVERLDVSSARLAEVDLSRAELHELSGLAQLAGAVISQGQLADLAPAFATHLGVRVVP